MSNFLIHMKNIKYIQIGHDTRISSRNYMKKRPTSMEFYKNFDILKYTHRLEAMLLENVEIWKLCLNDSNVNVHNIHWSAYQNFNY